MDLNNAEGLVRSSRDHDHKPGEARLSAGSWGPGGGIVYEAGTGNGGGGERVFPPPPARDVWRPPPGLSSLGDGVAGLQARAASIEPSDQV